MKKITMEDIAAQAGVSKATVSYVLNNKPGSFGISEKTAKRVLDAAQRLRYRPDQAAVALSELKNAAVQLLLLSPWLYAQHSDFMAQCNAALRQMREEHRLSLTSEPYDNGGLQKVLRPSRCEKYDAILVVGTSEADDRFLARSRGRYPNVILLNRRVEGYLSVSGNDDEITCRLASRIAGTGRYQSYWIVADSLSRCARLRMDGFARGLASQGIEARRYLMDKGCTLEEHLLRLLDRLLEDEGGSAALFSQYYPASRLLMEAQKAGIDVPKTVGIAGYDQNQLLQHYLPKQLTTVEPRIGEMTRAAVELAMEIKEGKELGSPLRPQILPAQIVEGETIYLTEREVTE